ncbi:MFS transporter [Nocardia bovistercoris]|uniref:MFS transporter n=1 Tax=Nocardia bovistercoris TaxID=2785916 RepID=A0A931I807_9NOCA|nr:MFS transporter [Nocardia bovistercoris]MBH0775075.1 MFS transporter [Nocardia bovistercoris]
MRTQAPELRRARIADSGAFATQGFFFAVVLSHLPQQQEKFGLSDATIAVGILLASALAGAGSLAAERLALRRSSRTALRLGLLLIAVTGCAVAYAPNTPVLLVTLGCYGVALGMVDASANMQAVFIQRGYGTVVLASFYAAWSAGSIGGALYVAATESLDVALRPSLLGAVGIALVAGLALGPSLLTEDEAEGAETTADRVAEPIARRMFLALGLAIALVFAVDVAVGSWSALYLTDELRASSATAAVGLAAYQAAALLARLTGDRWVRRFGPRAVVRAVAGLGAAGMALVVVAPGPAVAVAGFLVAGLGTGVIAPLCFSEAGESASGAALDALIARLNLFNYAGTLAAGLIVGGITAALTYRIGFVVPLLCAAALILLAGAFHGGRATDSRHGSPADRAVLDP